MTKSLGRESGLPSFGRLAGWSPDGREIVLVTSAWQRDEPTRIVTYDPQSDRTREIFESPRHRISPPDGDRVVAGKLPVLLAKGSTESPSGDGTFTLLEVECLGACDRAPVVMVNDGWHECLKPGDAAALLERIRAGGEAVLSGCVHKVEK